MQEGFGPDYVENRNKMIDLSGEFYTTIPHRIGRTRAAIAIGLEAIEVLVDHLSPGWSQFAKDAKDLGSLAVACTIGALLLYSGVALIW